MASKSQKSKNRHSQILADFSDTYSYFQSQCSRSLEDRIFVDEEGGQWAGQAGEQFENKYKPEFNKIELAVRRIESDYRKNRVEVDFVSKDGLGADKLASTLDGLYRRDNQTFVGNEAYDNAFQEGVKGGYGAWRRRPVYEDEYSDDNEYQRIAIELIPDADNCVFWDRNAKRFDKADAKKCWVLTAMSPDAFEEEWGIDPATFPHHGEDLDFTWCEPDVVYVAEYYEVVERSETIQIWENSFDGEEKRYPESDFEDDPELERTLTATGWRKIDEKSVKRRRVTKEILSGAGILEDCGDVPGAVIPIIPFYAKRSYLNGREQWSGHVRVVRDAQIMYNMLIAVLGEIATLSPREKPIFALEQIQDYATRWAEDNVKNYPYLLAEPLRNDNGDIVQTGPIGYTKPPSIPPALAALIDIVSRDIKELLGNQESGEEVMMNVSGKAYELIQQRLDLQSHLYVDNFTKSIKRDGEVWLAMAKDLYVEPGRQMVTIGKDKSRSTVTIGKPVFSDNGEVEFENDFSNANMEVYASASASSSSVKASTVRNLMSVLQFIEDPELKTVIGYSIVSNIEGEGVDDIVRFGNRKLLDLGIKIPTKEQAAEMQKRMEAQKPTPNDTYLLAEAKNSESKAEKAQADTILALAKAEETRAKTAEILNSLPLERQKAALEAMKAIKEAEAVQPQQMGENQG